MSDNEIHTGIAKVLAAHRFRADYYECLCQLGLPENEVMCMDRAEHEAHVTTELMREFGITEEHRAVIHTMFPAETREHAQDLVNLYKRGRVESRYVTEWTTYDMAEASPA